MQMTIDTRVPSLVKAEVVREYGVMFPEGNKAYVENVFAWAEACFTGKYRDYQPIDALYHDFEHTLQGLLCMARLLRARHLAKAPPVLTQHLVELGLLAILLHDTGYLKKRGDLAGTGAKYTLTHVDRSADFAATLMKEHGYPKEDIKAVQNMIRCTGVNVKIEAIPFQSEMERIAGYVLGTSDLLGQMAANDYVDKLPILFAEFAESAAYNATHGGKGKSLFTSAADLMEKTPGFWRNYVLPKINKEFLGLHTFLNDPFPSGPDCYIESIEANLARLEASLKRSPVPATA